MLAIVLAAGVGRRFGGAKAAAPLAGRPLVLHALDAARAAGIGRTIVVVGHDASTVAACVEDEPDVEVVVNEDHAQGQATSVQAGLQTAESYEDARIAVILLGDQPHVSPVAIRQVVAALEDGGEVARASYDDGPGHPVALARRVWSRLVEDLHGDQGARQLMDELEVAHVLVAGSMPPDVDRPEDLDRLASAEGDDEGQG